MTLKVCSFFPVANQANRVAQEYRLKTNFYGFQKREPHRLSIAYYF